MKDQTTTAKAASTLAPNPASFTFLAYGQLVKLCLKRDVVAGIFVFGWLLSLFSCEILNYQFGTFTARFYELFPKRDEASAAAILKLCSQFFMLLVMMAVGKGALYIVKGLLARVMRRNLVHYLHRRYFNLCGLKSIHQGLLAGLDCPDQRICSDTDLFVKGLITVVEVLFLAPILVVFYTFIIAGQLSVISVVIIYAHFVLGVGALRWAMKRIKMLTIRLERREAMFRTEHVTTVDQIESYLIANQPHILTRLSHNLNFQLQSAQFTFKQLILTGGILTGGKAFFSYSGSLLNFLLIIGELKWGRRWRNLTDGSEIVKEISFTSFTSLYLIFQLSQIVGLMDALGTLNGQIARLAQLLAFLHHPASLEGTTIVHEHEQQGFEVVFAEFTLKKASKTILDNLSFRIGSREHTLISGANGSGKTSILRLLTGIWPLAFDETSGKFEVKAHSTSGGDKVQRPFLMISPQLPLVFSGNLFDLLGIEEECVAEADLVLEGSGTQEEPSNAISLSSSPSTICDDNSIKAVLESVGLPADDLLSEAELKRTRSEWHSQLTPGQLQRLSLARIILNRPMIAALDESFLSMSAEEEASILRRLDELEITVILTDSTSRRRPDSIFKQNIQL